MREPEEVERLRLALASPLPLLDCVTPEFNQARFVRVKFQPKLSQAVLPVVEEPLRIWLPLESQDDIIGVPDDNHVAGCRLTPPPPDPEVEDVMQVDIREEW